MAMSEGLMEALLHEDEGAYLDFKQDQYPFAGATDDETSELLKDILAFANAWRRSTAYILIGVAEVKGGRSTVKGVTTHLAENSLQQFVNSKTNRPVFFSYEAFFFEGKQTGVITIPQQERPFFTRNDFGKVKKQTIYYRQGSSTAVASPDEVARMGAVGATDAWTHKELEQQRKDREEQRATQLRLHGEVYRPTVACDFPLIHTVLYLRVRNYGTLPAKDVQVSVVGDVSLPPIACLRHKVSFMAPDTELVYFLKGPREINTLPSKLTLRINYIDMAGRLFDVEQEFDFAYFGTPGSGEVGVDLGRENNDPVVRELRNIVKALEGTRNRSPFG